MIRSILAFAVLLTGHIGASGQTASSPEEGILGYDQLNGVVTLSWWGRTGTSYYVQFTENLSNPGAWLYYPIIMVGAERVARFHV